VRPLRGNGEIVPISPFLFPRALTPLFGGAIMHVTKQQTAPRWVATGAISQWRALLSIKQIQALVRNGLYCLTEHADDEATADGIDIYDVEHGILAGKIRRAWPQEGKYEVVGPALDGRPIGIVCRITATGKVRIITVYEDRPKT